MSDKMDDILKRYPAPVSKTIGPCFSYPDTSLDLHGYNQLEAMEKLDWFLSNAQFRRYHTLCIIAGIGKNILRSLVQKTLCRWKGRKDITYFEEVDNGVFWITLPL